MIEALDPAETSDNAVVIDNEGGMMSAAMPAARNGQNKILVADKFAIDVARPVPEFSNAFADAFECSGDGKSNDCIALLIKGRYPARHEVIKVALQTDIPGLIVLRTTAVVFWTPDNCERFALIYRRPAGAPLYNLRTQRREVVTEDILRRNIIRPLYFALRNLADRDIYHGNVRPDNIFFSGQESAEATLGDCVSTIPGIIQPALYETVERGMADPQGKGVGSSQDDIYAFGATIAVLYRGDDPLNGKADKIVVEEKVNRSSFSVLTDGVRLSPGLSEFLRATLNDDPKQRWNIEQVGAWVDGMRTTPKQTAIGQRAQRVMDFNGKKYIRPRLLARDLPENIPEAVAMIESGYLSKWLERALGDHERLEIVNEAIARAGANGRTQGYEDRLVSYVSMALDPRAPIRYKGINIYPHAIGHGLAFAILNGISVQPYAEILRERYAWLWLSYKENTVADSTETLRKFDSVSKLLIRRGINFGIERCLYELAVNMPCLSELIQNHYVLNCATLLEALDQIAGQQKSAKPIDRHIASFISVTDNNDNAGIISSIDSGDKIKYSLALLTLYQGLQKRSDNNKLVDLCEWLLRDAETVVQRFYNLNLKKEMQEALVKEAKSGQLRRMLNVIDNQLLVKKDAEDFKKATLMHRALGQERDRMRNELDRNRLYGQGSGRRIAMVISAILSGIVIAGLVLLNFLTNLTGAA